MNILVLIRENGLHSRTQHLPDAATHTPLSSPAASAPAEGTASAVFNVARYMKVRCCDTTVPALPPTAAFASAEVAVLGLEGTVGLKCKWENRGTLKKAGGEEDAASDEKDEAHWGSLAEQCLVSLQGLE